MRDVTLYENTERGYLSLHPPADAYGEVPAVVGITVAEIEQGMADLRDHVAAVARRASRHRRERDEAREALDVALIERNEARAELEKLRRESITARRAEAARYREALERIVAQLDPLYRIASDATAATDLAREALGE